MNNEVINNLIEIYQFVFHEQEIDSSNIHQDLATFLMQVFANILSINLIPVK